MSTCMAGHIALPASVLAHQQGPDASCPGFRFRIASNRIGTGFRTLAPRIACHKLETSTCACIVRNKQAYGWELASSNEHTTCCFRYVVLTYLQ